MSRKGPTEMKTVGIHCVTTNHPSAHVTVKVYAYDHEYWAVSAVTVAWEGLEDPYAFDFQDWGPVAGPSLLEKLEEVKLVAIQAVLQISRDYDRLNTWRVVEYLRPDRVRVANLGRLLRRVQVIINLGGDLRVVVFVKMGEVPQATDVQLDLSFEQGRGTSWTKPDGQVWKVYGS